MNMSYLVGDVELMVSAIIPLILHVEGVVYVRRTLHVSVLRKKTKSVLSVSNKP